MNTYFKLAAVGAAFALTACQTPTTTLNNDG